MLLGHPLKGLWGPVAYPMHPWGGSRLPFKGADVSSANPSFVPVFQQPFLKQYLFPMYTPEACTIDHSFTSLHCFIALILGNLKMWLAEIM